MAVSIISALVAASSLVYAIWRDKIARDERKKREVAEARLLEAHQEREDRLAEPEVIAEMTGHAPEGAVKDFTLSTWSLGIRATASLRM